MLNKIGSPPPQQQQAQLKRNSNPSFGNVLVEISNNGLHEFNQIKTIMNTPPLKGYSILRRIFGRKSDALELANVTSWSNKEFAGARIPSEVNNEMDSELLSKLEAKKYKAWSAWG